jgi:fructokinase
MSFLPMPQDRPRIVAIGEILWDMFPSGPRFGGAPANFAGHAASLNAAVSIVSGVGDDELGKSALRLLQNASIDTRFVAVDSRHPTGKVDVKLDASGHASYHFNQHEAWDHIHWTEAIHALASDADAVCFGTLSQRSPNSRDCLRAFVRATGPDALRVLDLNLRAPYYEDAVITDSLEMANVVKLNDEELRLVAATYQLDGSEIDQAREIAKRFALRLVAITRGTRGSLLVNERDHYEEPAQKVEVKDTVGAGDTFTAAMTVGLLRGIPLGEINRAASRMAEYVCTQTGATPPIPIDLRRPVAQRSAL